MTLFFSPRRSLANGTALLLALLALSCFPRLQEYKATELHLGTFVEITLLGEDRSQLERAAEAAFAEIKRVENRMSAFREDSEVSRINASAGGPPVPVSAELFTLLEHAQELSRLSAGAFDITIGALKGLWSFAPENPRLPTGEELAARLPLVSWEGVILDAEHQTVGLKHPGMRIDLGALAKGWAVDRAIEVILASGISGGMVNAGGDLRVIGQHHHRPWNIALQDPRDRDNLLALIRLSDQALATSGDYEKFFFHNGQRYCHILNPRTGLPSTECQSVTIIAPQAWLADGLATAVFVLGPEKGLALVERLKGVEGVIIDAQGGRHESSGLRSQIEWLSPP